MRDDGRLQEAKAVPVDTVVSMLGLANLRRNGGELTGPCPLCGGVDRFNINTRTGAFLCRKCDLRGGDAPALVMGVYGVSLPKALEFLLGKPDLALDPAEIDRRRRKAEAQAAEAEAKANRFRERQIARAREIWARALPAEDTPVRDYLARRAIGSYLLPRMPAALRFLPDHPAVKMIDRRNEVLHRGPCMIAAVHDARGDLTAVHQTWLDLSQPKGRAVITFRGEAQPSKMVIGSKKGGAIRLFGHPQRIDALVMGEGIETTLTALAAGLDPATGLWAAVDLGNMAGRMLRTPGTRHSGLPDMDDTDAFVPPPGVRRLVYIQDGDSDPEATRAKLLAGLRRAMARNPGLTAQLVHPGPGRDLNDLLRETATTEPGEPGQTEGTA